MLTCKGNKRREMIYPTQGIVKDSKIFWSRPGLQINNILLKYHDQENYL